MTSTSANNATAISPEERLKREVNAVKLVLHGISVETTNLNQHISLVLRSLNVEVNDQHFIKRARRLGSSKTVEITCSSTHLRSQTIRAKHRFLALGLSVDVALTQLQCAQRKASMPTFVDLDKTTLRPIWHYERIYVHVDGEEVPYSPALLHQGQAAAPSSSSPPSPAKPPSPPTVHTDSPAATPYSPAPEAQPISPAPTPAAQDVQQHATTPVATLQTTFESTPLLDVTSPLVDSAPPPTSAPSSDAALLPVQDTTELPVAILQTTHDSAPVEPPSPMASTAGTDAAGPRRKRQKPRGPSAGISPTVPKRVYDSSERPTEMQLDGRVWTILPPQHDRRDYDRGWCWRIHNAELRQKVWLIKRHGWSMHDRSFAVRLGGLMSDTPAGAVWIHQENLDSLAQRGL